MQRPIQILLPLLFIALASCQSDNKNERGPGHEPFDQFYFQRSFPDDHLNLREFDRVAQFAIDRSHQQTERMTDADWTQQGPINIGGRLNCIAVDPQNADVILTGSATGGIYKSADGGDSWEAIADDFAYMAIGDITFDPTNSQIIYAGTGDPNISGLPHIGNGIYKSVDGGESWEHKGLTEARIISRVLINPNNPEIVYASAMGLPFEENPDRGLYKSTDGGDTWEQILFIAENVGIIDLLMNPDSPDVLYAAGWNRIRNNTGSVVDGDDADIWRTTDGGENWEMLTNGLPQGVFSRPGLAMSGQNPDKLMALYVNEDYQIEGIYRSSDGGDSWSSTDWDEDLMSNALGGFGWYFGQIRMNPWNDQQISILGVNMYSSDNNGGEWYQSVPPWWTYEVHADKHDMVWIDENTVLLATDGGLYKSTDGMSTWTDIDAIPNTQFYRIALDPHDPGVYTGGTQDNGTTRGNSSIINDWSREYGGDGFQPVFDPLDDDVWYAETQNGGLVYTDGFDWYSFTDGIDSEDRRNWDMPIIMSGFTNQIMYTGTFRVYRNDFPPNGDWYPISEDLTDGIIYGEKYHTITTIAESGVNPDVLYAGTTDGNVWRTMDGNSWTNVTEGLPERYVTNIKTSSDTEAVVYVSHNGYKDNDNVSYLHRSDDFGDNWIDISGDLPDLPVNHIEIYDEDNLVIATDFGVYYSSNAGTNWDRVGANMPMIPVFDIEIDEEMDQLVAGTFARSIMTYPLDSLIIEDTPVGIPAVDELTLRVFPNPVENELWLPGDLLPDRFQIFDLSGNLVREGKMQESDSSIDVKSLNPGLYTMLYYQEAKIISGKFVKL
jgi:photosystem II stability/assembly factor-like uncharacterized protein